MLRSTRPVSIALGPLLLALTGCVASVQPLSDAKTSTPDLRLLGDWEYEDKGDDKKTEIVKLTIKKKPDSPKVLQIVADDGKDIETVDLYLTKIGNDYFASLQNDDKDGKKRYLIAKYELSADGTVKIWVPETEFFAKAVEGKKLKGKINQPSLFKDVLLDETPDNVRKFIKENSAKCFGKETDIKVRPAKKPAKAKSAK
jgi:hypothetical protein